MKSIGRNCIFFWKKCHTVLEWYNTSWANNYIISFSVEFFLFFNWFFCDWALFLSTESHPVAWRLSQIYWLYIISGHTLKNNDVCWNLWSEKHSLILSPHLLFFSLYCLVSCQSSRLPVLPHTSFLFLTLFFSHTCNFSSLFFASRSLHPFLTLLFSRGSFILSLHPWSLH